MAAVVLCYCCCLFVVCRRRRKKKRKEEGEPQDGVVSDTKDSIAMASASSFPSMHGQAPPSMLSLARELSKEISSTPLNSPRDYTAVVLDESRRESFYPPPPSPLKDDELEIVRRNLATDVVGGGQDHV